MYVQDTTNIIEEKQQRKSIWALFFFLIRKEEVTCGAWIHSVPSDGLALADACSELVQAMTGEERALLSLYTADMDSMCVYVCNAVLAACLLSLTLLVCGNEAKQMH